MKASLLLGGVFASFCFEAMLPTTLASEDHLRLSASPSVSSSCASVTSCSNCTNTYTCHWCGHDNACHAKGSIHGCTFGESCSKPKPPKENTTCSSHTTCSECSLSSHVCHWCEHDNACHAMGSRYGCAVGVDCYSNDRCRREEPEKFARFVVTEIPITSLFVVLGVGILLMACCTACYSCFGNVKGAYDDLATISMAASVAPLSFVGGTALAPTVERYTSPLETHPEGNERVEETPGEGLEMPADANGAAREGTPESSPPTAAGGDEEEANAAAVHPQAIDTTEPASSYTTAPRQQREECEVNHFSLLEVNPTYSPVHEDLHTPLLTPFSSGHSFNGVPGMEEPRHMKALYRACSFCYFLAITMVVALVGAVIFFYPKPPVYNVCNDAIAWKEIVEHLVAFKLDASFEILVSVSNPNHVDVALDQGKGSFSYDGKQVGSYEIPPNNVAAMAVTDLMLIARVMPDRYQAIQMAQAYYHGNLVLEADFKAKLRVPALMDFTYNLHMEDITVYVNAMSDRSLCRCPAWDNQTVSDETPMLFF